MKKENFQRKKKSNYVFENKKKELENYQEKREKIIRQPILVKQIDYVILLFIHLIFFTLRHSENKLEIFVNTRI